MAIIGIVYDWLMLKEYDADLCFSSLDIIESNMLIFKFFMCSHGTEEFVYRTINLNNKYVQSVASDTIMLIW
jgi:hypothetical protein